MKLTPRFALSMLATMSCSTLMCMQQPRTLEKKLLTLQKALSSSKLRHLNHARELLRCNREFVTAYFRGRPISHAAQTAAALQLLQACGGKLNGEDRYGNSALHNAQNSATTLALLAAGMDVNQRNSEDQTALFFARSARQVEILVQLGADVNMLDKFGRTPLYYARTGAVAKALLKAGALLDIEDENGRTPGQALIHTNPDAAREVEFFLTQQAERKEVRQQRASKKPAMVWRAKPKLVIAAEMEQKANDELIIPALLIEQLEAEAQQEAELQEAKLTEQKTIQNSTPVILQAPVQQQAQMPTDPLARFAHENSFAALQDDADESTPAPQPIAQSTTIKKQINTANRLDRFAQPNRFAALMINDDTSVVQQPAAPVSKPKHKHKHKKHVAFAMPIVTNQPATTTTNSATPLPEEEHIEFVPQVHTTIRHITPTDIPNSTPIMVSQAPAEYEEPTVMHAPTVQHTSTVPNHNATAQESFKPFESENYYSVLETTTPELPFEWVDVMAESKM